MKAKLLRGVAQFKSSTSESSTKALATLLLIVAGGTALRLYKLESETLWFDESVSWFLATSAWSDYAQSMWRSETNMVLYYLLLRRWTFLGESEWMLRSLSVLFGVVAIGAIYVLGKHLFGTREALVGAALLAINAFHIRYSQEARSYSLLVLLLIISSYCLVRAIESSTRWKWWAAYIAASALAVYAHSFAVFALLSHFIAYNLTHNAQRTTHNAQRTTHNAQPSRRGGIRIARDIRRTSHHSLDSTGHRQLGLDSTADVCFSVRAIATTCR